MCEYRCPIPFTTDENFLCLNVSLSLLSTLPLEPVCEPGDFTTPYERPTVSTYRTPCLGGPRERRKGSRHGLKRVTYNLFINFLQSNFPVSDNRTDPKVLIPDRDSISGREGSRMTLPSPRHNVPLPVVGGRPVECTFDSVPHVFISPYGWMGASCRPDPPSTQSLFKCSFREGLYVFCLRRVRTSGAPRVLKVHLS